MHSHAGQIKPEPPSSAPPDPPAPRAPPHPPRILVDCLAPLYGPGWEVGGSGSCGAKCPRSSMPRRVRRRGPPAAALRACVQYWRLVLTLRVVRMQSGDTDYSVEIEFLKPVDPEDEVSQRGLAAVMPLPPLTPVAPFPRLPPPFCTRHLLTLSPRPLLLFFPLSLRRIASGRRPGATCRCRS
eukprot:COSAG02_NODE_915_length_15986_cov_16.498584_7_plen_183_part_00